ncbi:MAG TPA: SAM-dependent chlorinase/fluorinase [Thermosynechococcaceae cyanobacterium]
MAASGILTLLSDFGLSDVYVGVMKGAIAQVNPCLTVIDLTHQVPPQGIATARFALMSAYPYFPSGTVHTAIVDPGVGGSRRAIAVALGRDLDNPSGFLVAPDNGLVSGVLSQNPVLAVVELTSRRYWRTAAPSSTFHGRDIFATVGAHLASGVALAELGEEIDPLSIVQLPLPNCQVEQTGDCTKITGFIQAIDHFGNLITNIPGSAVISKRWVARINHAELTTGHTYSGCPFGFPLALVGSHGFVEIAVNGGNAQTRLLLDWGEAVEVVVGASGHEFG